MANQRTMADVEAAIGADAWRQRVEEADAEAAVLAQVLERVRAGESKSAALRALRPNEPLESVHRRLLRFERQGRDGLINRRVPVTPPGAKMTAEARGTLRALAMIHADEGTDALAARLSKMLGTTFSKTTVLSGLHALGLARPVGRPPGTRPTAPGTPPREFEEVTPLPLAGCELLKAVDLDIGAVQALTRAMGAHLDALPEPTGPVRDDSENRDEKGRFLPEYNRPELRAEPEIGARFETVEKRRGEKNLPAMRVAKESEETRWRKNLGLVLLPCVIGGSRWSELEHWRGDRLDELIGYAYQASTLDKYVRGLKLTGAAETCREASASFWLGEEGVTVEAKTGAVVLYADVSTKPLWTHTWTRSAKVSKNGRVMPAISTMTLHSGAGTPIVYRSWSGQVSLPAEVTHLLDEYERHAGASTVRRVVVMDREAHSVALFKQFGDARRYIVPLRENVVGPKARFEDVGPWGPYGDGPDEVCDGHLWLNDNRKGEKPLRVRVVGRKRHRTGKVAWYATNVLVEEFTPTDVIRVYFERWPAQEHVYRNINGVVGFDVHHGYGKKKVDNVAILDRIEQLDGQLRRWTVEKGEQSAHLAHLRGELAKWDAAHDYWTWAAEEGRGQLDADVQSGGHHHRAFPARFEEQQVVERWLAQVTLERQRLNDDIAAAQRIVADREERLGRAGKERESIERRRQIFTVDVELDEIMTAFKFTFLNLCGVLMDRLLGKRMEIPSLIDAVLSLPGERVVTASTETIRIFRPKRDAPTIAAVERACRLLTERGLTRDKRALRFEVTAAV